MDQKTPEVGHIKDSLLVGTEEVKELLNTEDEAFYKLIKHLLGFIIIIISCVAETKLKGKDMEEGVFSKMILDRICSWLLPEEVKVGPLEVFIVKGKGEDCAEIGIIILTAVFFCERNVTKNERTVK